MAIVENVEKYTRRRIMKFAVYGIWDAERAMLAKMSKELGRRMGAQNEKLEVFKRENTKNNQM